MKKLKNRNIFSFFLFFVTLINFLKSEQIKVFNHEGSIEFAKIKEFSIKFQDLNSQTSEFYLRHSFLSIIANVTLDEDCFKKSTCSQPIRIYGKINDIPRPEDIYFDRKDDTGKSLGGSSLIYGFEYSPCQLHFNDTLNIKLVGVEGKSNFTLSVNFNYLPNYKVLCAGGLEPSVTLYPASAYTPLGTIKYGGKLNQTALDDNLYLLKAEDEDNLHWSILETNSNFLKPSPRYGHFLAYFEGCLILFGGKNLAEQVLNDLWVFDINSRTWILIDYSNSKNIPKPKFLSSGEYIQNFGSILLYGGKNNFDDNNIYILNLKILLELVQYKKFYLNPINKNLDFPEFEYSTKVNHLFTIKEVKDLIPRYGLTITQIKDTEVMLFGGFDRSDYSLSRLEILNLTDFSVKIIEPNTALSEFPYARGFHQILRYGSILILYGGKSGTGENLNDLWKFLVNSKKWVKVEDKSTETEFYLFKSGFVFTKINNSERPLILGGENKNKENSNVLVLMDFEICTSDVKIFSSQNCIPCAEGFVMSDQKKCVGCAQGSYLDVNTDYYLDSRCEKCPQGNYNDKSNQKGISSCKICDFGFYNNKFGQNECEQCKNDELCLPGAVNPVKDDFILNNIDTNYQADSNYPDYLHVNNKIKTISRTTAFTIVFAITGTMLLILLICYKIKKAQVTKCLISLDFIPLTGGSTKKCSGGLITAIYSILIFSLAFSFVMRYIYFNQLFEVIPLAHSNNEHDSLKATLLLNVDIVGSGFTCVNKDENLNQCSRDLEIFKVNHNNYFANDEKALMCNQTQEGHCRVTFKCEDCNTIENNDVIQIHIKNPKAFVQLYRWSFESVWDENFNYSKGFSKIEGIYRPDNNKKSNRVFRGDSPSTIQILLTPIFYENKNDGVSLSGHRASLKQYSRGSIRDEFTFYQKDDGVRFNVQFFYATNSYQVNAKKQIEFLDFYAFILGMLAGFSFLSRISKYICEKLNIFDVSYENYVELEEAEERKEEKLEKLEKFDKTDGKNEKIEGNEKATEMTSNIIANTIANVNLEIPKNKITTENKKDDTDGSHTPTQNNSHNPLKI